MFNNEKVVVLDDLNLSDEEDKILEVYKTLEQAMIDKDMETLNRIIVDGSTFTHMSGKVQTKKEFLGEIEDGTLNYFKAEISNINISINSSKAHMTGNVRLTARVYGMSGTWTLNINDNFEKIEGIWYYSKLDAKR